MADLPVQKQPSSFGSPRTGPGTGFELPERRVLRHIETQTRRVVGMTAEESGYDSDATRKSSPRSSLKNETTAVTSSNGKVIVGSSDDCDSR